MIPENIHTIQQAASWNSEGEGGFLDWNSEGTGKRGCNAVLNSKCMGEVSALNFQRGKMTKALLEIVDLSSFSSLKIKYESTTDAG